MHLIDYVFLKNIVPFTEQTNEQMQELMQLARDPETGVEIKDRSWHLRSYKKCFVAKDFITWLSTKLHIERHVAVRIGLFLQQRGYLVHVVGDHLLKDDFLFFRFTNLRSCRKKSLSEGDLAPVLINKSLSGLRETIKKRLSRAKTTRVSLRPTPKLDLPLYLTSKAEVVIETPQLMQNSFNLASPTVQDRRRAKSCHYTQLSCDSPTALSVLSDDSGPPGDSTDRDMPEYEIIINTIRVKGLQALPKKCCGGREGKDIITKGLNRPYCKLVIEDEVVGTEVVDSLDPVWFPQATFCVTRFPAHLTVAILDQDKAPMVEGSDLFGYFDILIDEQGTFNPEDIELQTASGRDTYVGASANISFSCKLKN
jgi:hypothetical protein